MKKIMIAALALCMALALAACGKANPVTGYKSGDVTLGQYKGLTYTAKATEVTDEEVEKSVQNFITTNKKLALITDRTVVEDGDVVNIDYKGLMNGEEFEGGSDEGFDLTIGSGSFIPGFEEGLIGATAGEKVTLDIAFPDLYPTNPDFAGKPVTFEVTVNYLQQYETPEFNDELVSANSDYKTTDEFREGVRAELKAEKESEAEQQKQADVVSKALANATFNKDLTEEILRTKTNTIAQYDSQYASYGVTAASFFEYVYGMSAEQFDEYMQAQATTDVQYQYLLSAIVEAEGFEATTEEVNELINEMITYFGYESEEQLISDIEKGSGVKAKVYFAENVKLQKATELLFDSAVSE